MDIVLEQILASAVRYIQDAAEGVEAFYFDDLPEGFAVPSIYFPVPRTTSRKKTLDTYLTTVYMEAWCMASTDWLAYGMAAGIRDAILYDDCKIRYVNKDGTASEKGFRVSEPEIKSVDVGIVKILLSLHHYASKAQEVRPAVEGIEIPGLLGPARNGTYAAWYAATETQRKEEEVHRAWLQRAMKSLRKV